MRDFVNHWYEVLFVDTRKNNNRTTTKLHNQNKLPNGEFILVYSARWRDHKNAKGMIAGVQKIERSHLQPNTESEEIILSAEPAYTLQSLCTLL